MSESCLLCGLSIADVGTLPDATYGWKGYRWHWRWRAQVRAFPGHCRRSKHSIVHLTRSTLSPLYMAEISPPEVRGSLLALEQFSIVLGCVLGFWTGFLTRNSKSESPLSLVELRSLLL